MPIPWGFVQYVLFQRYRSLVKPLLSLRRGGQVKSRSKPKLRIVVIPVSGIRIQEVGKSVYMDQTEDPRLISIGIMIMGKGSHILTTGARTVERFLKMGSRRGHVTARTLLNAADEERWTSWLQPSH
jgi:hypothetical protein